VSKPHVAFQEWFKQRESGQMPKPPIARLLGFDVTLADQGQASAVIEADQRLANPMGTMHGGIICDIADAAMGCALASTLTSGETFTTVEIKANYFKPIWNARLEAKARVVRRTRQLAYLECDVVDGEGSLVARAASTCMILRGPDAAGR
jgi:uncharacterized protein (TIGR00369 family)